MSLKMRLGFNQQLTISHRMRQSLTVLSLSCEDLSQAIQKELLENPLLETVEEAGPSSFQKKISEVSHFRMYDFLEADYKKTTTGHSDFSEEFLSETASLKSDVLKQAEMSFFSKEVKMILPVLISHLDERAYLDLDIRELAKKENIPFSLLTEALKALQSLEPAGLGGRNLQECLLIQLRRKKAPEKASLIVKHHLSHIKDKKYKAIAYNLNISMKETMELCRLIQSLEPNPARSFSSHPTVFIRPDLYIYKQGSEYCLTLNNEDFPQLRFSYEYARAIKNSGKLKDREKKYFNEKRSSAHWFIHAIEQRLEKLKKIGYYLIRRQKDFFEHGISYLQPLKMQDLAEELDVHVSTISRAVHNKYAHTPQGMISLKSFFQKGFENTKGRRVSMAQVKESIKQWIKEEDLSYPLSDKQIQEKIQSIFRIQLLRRSVSQYRASMGIPPCRIRKLGYLSSQELGG